MADWLALPALAWAVPGFVVQMYGLCAGHAVAAVLGSMLLVFGLTVYSAGKGYNRFWGLWGVVPIIGILVLIASRPRRKLKPREMVEAVLLEEDPSIHPSTVNTRETPLGGTWLLALLGPWGILFIFLMPYAPQLLKVLEAPRSHVEVAGEPGTEMAEEDEEAVEAESEEAPPPAPALPASTVPVKEPPAPVPVVQPAVAESAKPPPAPPSFEDRYRQVGAGLTVEQVDELCGDKTDVISEALTGARIIRWESPEGDSFAARFHGDKLDRKTALHKAPPKAKINEMASEIASAEAQESSTSKEPPVPQPPPAEPVQVAQTAEDENATKAEGETEAPPPAPPKVIRIGGEAKTDGRARKARLPRYTFPIDHGANDVHLYNFKGAKVTVGVRSNNRGQNVTIPSGGMATIYVPNGDYTVYFIDSSEPTELKNGGGFQVNSPPGAIQFPIR